MLKYKYHSSSCVKSILGLKFSLALTQYFSLKCDFCGKIDDQEHLLQCVSPSEIDTSVSQYKDIFGTLTQQIRIAKIMKRIADKRKYLNISSSDGSRAHQP